MKATVKRFMCVYHDVDKNSYVDDLYPNLLTDDVGKVITTNSVQEMLLEIQKDVEFLKSKRPRPEEVNATINGNVVTVQDEYLNTTYVIKEVEICVEIEIS
jgi:hypothetical protein